MAHVSRHEIAPRRPLTRSSLLYCTSEKVVLFKWWPVVVVVVTRQIQTEWNRLAAACVCVCANTEVVRGDWIVRLRALWRANWCSTDKRRGKTGGKERATGCKYRSEDAVSDGFGPYFYHLSPATSVSKFRRLRQDLSLFLSSSGLTTQIGHATFAGWAKVRLTVAMKSAKFSVT